MVSRSKTRIALKKALAEQTKIDGSKYRYPMTKFRHAIFETVSRCKLISDCSFSLSKKDKICSCILSCKTRKFYADYDYKTDVVKVQVLDNLPESNELVKELVYKSLDVKDFAEFVYQNRPKIKIIRKIK